MRATELGMVPNPYPVYLTLPNGQVVGNPTSISGYEIPDVRYRTPDELAALAQKAADAEAKRIADLAAKAKAAKEAKAKAAEEKKKAEAEAKAKAKAKADAKKAAEEAAKKKTGKKNGTDR